MVSLPKIKKTLNRFRNILFELSYIDFRISEEIENLPINSIILKGPYLYFTHI